MIKKCLFKKLNYKFSKINASLNLKPLELNLADNAKCLCLCPHADDESIGMGGFLAMHPENFNVILLTDGQKGIKGLESQEVTKIRDEEFSCAMKCAKVEKISFLHAKDKKLLDAFDDFQKIQLKDYDYIFLPNIIDQHPDHKAVSLLLNRMLESAELKKDLKICFYEVWSTLGFVNAFVDITGVIETKKAMINCYKSQTAQKNYEYHALGLNQYRGMFKDKDFVEAFCVMSVDEFINISKLY